MTSIGLLLSGILLDSGIIVSGHTSDRDTPGPGHYGPSTVMSPKKGLNNTTMNTTSRSKSVGRNVSTTSLFGTSRRLSHDNSVIRYSIIYDYN
jgi:hypothetical protein